MRKLIVGCALLTVLGALAGCASVPPAQDPAIEAKFGDLDQRVTRVEQVIANKSLVDMAQNVQGMEDQLRVLQGRIDELENENDALRKQQLAFYQDLDKRLTKLAIGNPGTASSGATPGVGDEQSAYMQALNSLKNGQVPQAISELEQFLAMYPQSDLADNAQYWLGEAYYVTHNYASAATAFRGVLDRYPNSRKASDALLKLGYTQYELKQYAKARATLAQVRSRFPGSSAAQLAANRLRAMAAAADGGGGGEAGTASGDPSGDNTAGAQDPDAGTAGGAPPGVAADQTSGAAQPSATPPTTSAPGTPSAGPSSSSAASANDAAPANATPANATPASSASASSGAPAPAPGSAPAAPPPNPN